MFPSNQVVAVEQAFPLPELEALQVTLPRMLELLGCFEVAREKKDRMHLPLPELERLRECLHELEPHQRLLEAELERVTRPDAPRPRLSSRASPGVTMLGETYDANYHIRVYLWLLRQIWSRLPERRVAVADALADGGRCRTYVACTPEALFPGRTSAWSMKHCAALPDGWYADTNLSSKQIRRLAGKAIDAAGLRLGVDVLLRWPRS